ncbi:MAG: isopentenyl-diphosphate Delta-isomerase [Candidatus Levybacteria bacterium CG10_big_fil_rev_8_21_14_0_10_36_7]|nr:MAG: isopentenyl-diphosphate Delta-isomerase [Candidatus Levybacteria bacterium CG10_big_fil_rev_8_21_14_0_10_36_7]
MIENVVLVDEENKILGIMPKSEVHQKGTPLHRAFSIFVFNEYGELLLQQRSSKKKTWPLVWSNSCCGHPQIDESNIDAARRRLFDELGIKLDVIEEVSPYRYKFSRDGIMENEICPILVGFVNKSTFIKVNSDEVENIRWVKWSDWLKDVEKKFNGYSPWCIEETFILSKNKKFKQLLDLNLKNKL